MEDSLRQLQEDLLSEWGKLEGQVTKLDLWMAENGHTVTEAASSQTRQLFKKRKFKEQDAQNKISEVVDELQLHKERILGQIRKFSEIGIKFKEFGNETNDNISEESGSPEVKMEVDAEDNQEILDPLQNDLDEESAEFSEEDNHDDQSNSNDVQDNRPEKLQTETLSKNERRFRCRKKCGNRFATKEWLERHEADCNPFVKCSICSKTVKKRSLIGHMKLIHKITQPPAAAAAKVVITATGTKSFPCSHCSKIFATNETLSYHMRAVQGERPFVCRKGCLATFSSPSARCRHDQKCTGKVTSRQGRKPVYVSAASTTTDNVEGTTGTLPEGRYICRKSCKARFLKPSHRDSHEKSCPGRVTSSRGKKPGLFMKKR